MPRREDPIDPEAGPVQGMAHDLRLLRQRAGLTYRELAARSGYSRTTLHDAAMGKSLPSHDVLLTFVTVCGGNTEEWTRRWHQVSAELAAIAPQTAAASVPTRNYSDPALRDLAEEVHRLWVREVFQELPTYPLHTDVRLASLRDAVRNSYGDTRGGLGQPKPMQAGVKLIDLFESQFNRRCLVLGSAGAGKTTVLLGLARDLLNSGKTERDAQVPVVLPLSRWAPRADGLIAWVVEEMGEHYKVDAPRALSWLAEGRVALLLDGLDEVAVAHRADCVQAINNFRRDSRCSLTGLVVSSRTHDYADVAERGARLELGGAVTLLPLTAEQVTTCLAEATDLLPGVRQTLQEDPVLADLLANPLMLRVAILAYGGRHLDPALKHGTAERRRQHIFDQYLHHMLTRDRNVRPVQVPAGRPTFSPRTTHAALVWLARLMNRRGETIFYPDWFTPTWLPASSPPAPAMRRGFIGGAAARYGWQRIAVAHAYGLAGGVIGATSYGLHALLANGIDSDTVVDVPPFFGLLIGVAVYAAIAWSTTAATRAGVGPRVARLAFCAVVFVVSGGLFRGVLLWQQPGNKLSTAFAGAASHGLTFGFTGVFSALLALCLARWLVHIDSARPEPRWHWSWERMEKGMFTAVVISPAVGLAHAIAYALSHLSTVPVPEGLLFGLGQGMIMGLSVGLAIGLAFALVDTDADQPATRWRWSLRRLGFAGLAAVSYMLGYGLLLTGVAQIVGRTEGAAFGVIVGLMFWITFALGHGLAPDRSLPPPAPAKALSASLRAAIPPSLALASLVALSVTVAAWYTSANVVEVLRLNLVTPTILAATLTFWFTGGAGWLAHHAARWAASRAGLLPRNILGFLAHADERLLLRRAGGGYQFLHRTLQDWVAARDPEEDVSGEGLQV